MPIIDQLIFVLLGFALGMSTAHLIVTTPKKEKK